MKLCLCQNGQEFLDRYESILLPHEVVYQLIMGNAIQNRAAACAPNCFFGAITDEAGRPLLLFGHIAPWRLLIHSLDDAFLSETVPLLAAFVLEQQIPISGFLASEAICRIFLPCDTAHSYRRGHSMDIMELRTLQDIAIAPGHFRPAAEADLPLIAGWYSAFHEEALGGTLDYAVALEKNRDRLSSFYLYETPEGVPCAMACIARVLRRGCCVSNVYTDPAQRGRSYCASLMYAIAQQQLAGGFEYLGLFVDQANPISNHVYQKVGYRILEDSVEYDRVDG